MSFEQGGTHLGWRFYVHDRRKLKNVTSGVTTDPADPAMRGARSQGAIRNTLNFFTNYSNAYLFTLLFCFLPERDYVCLPVCL